MLTCNDCSKWFWKGCQRRRSRNTRGQISLVTDPICTLYDAATCKTCSHYIKCEKEKIRCDNFDHVLTCCICGTTQDLRLNKSRNPSSLCRSCNVATVITKTKAGMFKAHGVEHNWNRGKLRNKLVAKWKKDWGVDNCSKLQSVQDSKEETFFKNYGVTNIFADTAFMRKAYEKSLGVSNPSKANFVKARKVRSALLRYGVDNVRKAPEIIEKIYYTKKANGTLGRQVSYEERCYFEFLRATRGTVEQQKFHKGFCIDFYIKEEDLYIQFDGDYYHGYLNTEEDLRKTSTGLSILKTKRNDEKQNIIIENLERVIASDFKICINCDLINNCYKDKSKNTCSKWTAKAIYKPKLTYAYTREECKREYLLIRQEKGSFKKSPKQNKTVLTNQHHFWETENKRWHNIEDKKFIIKNREKYRNKIATDLTEKELLRGFKISGLHYGFSHFSPLWLKAFIEQYKVTSIYDPCAGWGHRLLGAASAGIPYRGNDIDPRTVEGLKQIRKKLCLQDVTLTNHDSSLASPNFISDCVFTCPPYFDTEIYTFEKTSTMKYPDVKQWLDVWWRKTIKNSLRCQPRLVAFVLGSKYKNVMLDVCAEERLTLIKSIPIGSKKMRSHMQRQNKRKRSNQETLYVFTPPTR